jgi:hypothetical protein
MKMEIGDQFEIKLTDLTMKVGYHIISISYRIF